MQFGEEEIGESLSISSNDYSEMLSAVSLSTAGSPINSIGLTTAFSWEMVVERRGWEGKEGVSSAV